MSHIEFNALLKDWRSDPRMTITALRQVSGYSESELRKVRNGKFDAAIPDLILSMPLAIDKQVFSKHPTHARAIARSNGLIDYKSIKPCKTCRGFMRIVESNKCAACEAVGKKRQERITLLAAKKELAA